MLQPDFWYQTTAKYVDIEEVPRQDILSSVPNRSEYAPYLSESHSQQLPSLYSISDFLPPSAHAPLETSSQETFQYIFSQLSTPTTSHRTFAGALWPANIPQFDTGQAGLYRMPEQIGQIGGRSEIDQTSARNPVSYQTSACSSEQP